MRFFGAAAPGPQEIQGVQISTAVNSLPTPICYGTPRCGGNVIWLNGFIASPAPTSSAGKGGKDPGAYVYNAWFIMALCEGPVGEPLIKYIDGVGYGFTFDYFSKTLTVSGLTWQNGSYTQDAIPDVVDRFPNEALAYRGVANVFGLNYRIDPTATVPQFNFIVPGFYQGTCPLFPTIINVFVTESPFSNVTVNLGFADADPSVCIYDLLTNPIYGVGFPAALINNSQLFSNVPNAYNPSIGDASYQTYCQAVGFGFSVCLDSTESASSIIQRWCELTNTAPVWTGTTLNFIPYGDTYQGGNPGFNFPNPSSLQKKYYNPNTTPIFSLTDDDFMQSESEDEDPLTIDRKDISDIYNTVRLSFRDRTNAWDMNVSEAKDENHIELYGIRVDNLAEAKEFTLSQYSAQSAQLRVQRNVAIDRTFSFKLSWAYCLLEPMDIVAITDATIGLNQQPVRIISIEENDKDELEIVAEIFLGGSASAVLYPKQPSSPSTAYYPGAAPSPVNTPFIFEPTAAMQTALGQSGATITIGASAGASDTADPNWGGALVYISLTETGDYSFLGTINGQNRMGALITSALSAYSSANPDNTNTLYVDLGESGGTLETVTTDQALAALTNTSLCAVINQLGQLELLSYTTATLTGPNEYALTGLYRGLYGTTGNSANAGTSTFLRIDPGTFNMALPPQFVGQMLWVKFVSFNIAGVITADLSTSAAYDFTPSGSGFNFFNVSGSFSGSPTASQVIFHYAFAFGVTFPTTFDGSVGSATVASTGTATFNITKNGSNIGTMVFTSAATATFTLASPTSFNSGDILEIVAPGSPDGTLANIAWTLLGQTF